MTDKRQILDLFCPFFLSTYPFKAPIFLIMRMLRSINRGMLGQKGVALIEAALLFPVLLILVFGSTLVAHGLSTYFIVSSTAYEGARFGSTLLSLEDGQYNSMQTLTSKPRELELHDRVAEILKLGGLDTSLAAISVTYKSTSATGNQTPGLQDYLVTVNIQYAMPLQVPLFSSITLSSTASGPYLRRPPPVSTSGSSS